MKKFFIPDTYHSSYISYIKQKRYDADKLKKDFSPTLIELGNLHIILPRHFGFCYGVENAIEIAFKTISENPHKRIFLLSEMIHNPHVNGDLLNKGVLFLQDEQGNELYPISQLHKDDIVLTPAFGTTLEIEKQLKEKDIQIDTYNTTCPFVEKVWNRSNHLSQKGYTIIIHGKPAHEETKATFSHAHAHGPTLIIKNMEEAILLSHYITQQKDISSFFNDFQGRYSKGFNPSEDLKKIAIVNQTTQLSTDTQAITQYIKNVMIVHFQLTKETLTQYFADTKDTLCYATNDNQTALIHMLDYPAHLSIVIGGYNSSNTSHLVELCEKKLPTYFIHASSCLSIEQKSITHTNWKTKKQSTTYDFLPTQTPIKIMICSGASCPNSQVEQVIQTMIQMVEGSLPIKNITIE